MKKGLRFKVGMAAMPHPFKRPDGVGANRRYVYRDTQTQADTGRLDERLRGQRLWEQERRDRRVDVLCYSKRVEVTDPSSFVSCRCVGCNDH